MNKVTKILAVAGLIMISGCATNPPEHNYHHHHGRPNMHDMDKPPMIGGDKDKHGCLPAAGYTWSGIKNKCIRVWEDGIRLDEKNNTSSAQFSAFLVFPDNSTDKVEVYLPGKEPVIINATSDYTWEGSNMKITRYRLGHELKADGKVYFHNDLMDKK